MAIRARFKPTLEGEFHPGIPSRDLDDADWETLDEDQRRLVQTSKLYDYRPERAANQPALAEGGKG